MGEVELTNIDGSWFLTDSNGEVYLLIKIEGNEDNDGIDDESDRDHSRQGD